MMKSLIAKRFSASAKDYDGLTSLHRGIADDLFSRMEGEGVPSAVLDVGCGTGYLTGKLKDRWPQSRIVGLDFARGMLEIARSKNEAITWVLGNGDCLPFADHSFDRVISNLAYQWAEDLPRMFNEAQRVLRPKGIFSGTVFGFQTCQELFSSLNEACQRGLVFERLPREDIIREALISSGFNNPQVDSQLIKLEFDSMNALMVWLKSIGANSLLKEGSLGPEALSRAALIYKNQFPYLEGVGASFEVIRFYVKK